MSEQLQRGEKKMSYRADSKREISEQYSKVAVVSVYLLMLVIAFALAWAYFAKVEEVTKGDGKIVASSELQVIEHLEGGIIKSIPVKEGQRVHVGEVLIELDDTRFKSEYNETLAKVAIYDAEIARLTAEAMGADHVTFDEAFEKKNPELVKQTLEYFNTNQRALGATIDILTKSYKLMQKEHEIIQPLVKEGVMANIDLIRLERQLNELDGQILEKKEKARSDAQSQLNKIKSERAVLLERLGASKDRMERTVIKSPVDGVVQQLFVSTIGEVVQPGSKILDLVPIEDTLTVQAYIKPSDIGFIHPGQRAIVKISAYDYSIYGGLNAEVKTISADAITDQRGSSFYEVKLETVKDAFVDKKGKSLEIIPGMTVTVNIITGKKSVMDYLMKPFLKARYNALRER